VTTLLPPLTDATFDEEVGGSSLPVLVDFTAGWCPPCHALAPVLAEVADEHADRLRVVSVDIDQQPELARRFGIMSFPTLLLFRDGVVVNRLVGARGKARLLQELADDVFA
jgi:thioredoxin 1